MDCHESLMQRRRKKKTAAKKPNIQLDKSLPSLPPNAEAEDHFAREADKPAPKPHADVSPDPSSRNRSADHRAPSRGRVEGSPVRQQDPQDNLILPSSTYRNNRHSIISTKSDADGGEEFLIPVAFDPSGEERPSSRGVAQDSAPPVQQRDLLDSTRSAASSRQVSSSERHESPSQNPSPHIAYQEKGRQPGNIDPTRWRQDSKGSQGKAENNDAFKLQDAPKSRKASVQDKEGASASATSSPKANDPSKTPQASSQKSAAPVAGATPSRPSHELQRLHENGSTDSARSLSSAPTMQFPPKRGDSLEHYNQIQRKEVGSAAKSSSASPSDGSKDKSAGKGSDSKAAGDATSSSASHADAGSEQPKDAVQDSSSRPRPSTEQSDHTRNGSVSTMQSESQRPADLGSSPSLLRFSGGGDFSMDEDMARIWGELSSNNKEGSESFLKRVSNSVRHGRSFSDKGTRLSKDSKWPKSPVNDISSPSTSSPEQHEDISWLRSELRRERQRVIERDQKIAELEAALNATAAVQQANSELREKRSTMVVLDTRKEIVLRELSVLTEHLEAEKQGGEPLDLNKLTSNVLREFAQSLQKLKDEFQPQIEELMQKRHELVEEIANLSRMKDKSFQEFEQLSSKNAQLAELNNQLVHQIQELYKANSGAPEAARAANGLGIFHNKEKSAGSVEAIKASTNDLATSISTMTIQQDEAEPATIVPGPQVVSIRKGQPRKFNWKKGGQNVAKGVTKGLKGAFSTSESKESVPHSSSASQDNGSSMPRSQTQDPSRQGFGFFGNQKKQAAWKTQQNGSSPAPAESAAPAAAAAAAAPAADGLFGVELEQRLEQEKCIIPAIVTRCIQEVELRGMDVEGIYRKSGASSVTQAIRDGFERSSHDFDISDPDLDIHAVTSALKQYFRKLPTPLITYDVYEKLLDTIEITPHSARIEAVRRSLEGLPRVHRDVLEFLVFHLKRVVEHEKENLMSSQNIAVVFAPTIMRPESIAREMTDVQKKNEALKFIVENCQEVFM
ncbi:Rho GTPase activator Rga [Rasamsonia emersonii CBS 393.64]|uniref:Rho GTPase activator Rga n=1 Tax=Rasamsonia emersonii (strain ATCC 16479 / CBS 393.64 / IMI 116815) TaxID=1408163 RepID=A0A0F4YYI6_RASE3|nr:Rho GTPase activator Rga [Rasamsonia emersonii CBS 393.64]KKA23304.1 Rho GTPase activator Rga [Rasamsonia emersonii CBS 393.64]